MPEFLVEMAILPWLLAGASIVKGIGNLYKANKASKRASKKYKVDKGNIAELEKGYLARNALQKKFTDRLKKRAKHGALPVQELESQVSSRVGEYGQQAKSEQLGLLASRGLEGSGVAGSLTGRVDAVSMQAIARAARSIRISNEATKINAQNMLGRQGDVQSDLRRELANRVYAAKTSARGAYDVAKNQSDAYMGDAFSMPLDALTAYQSGTNVPQWRKDPSGKWVWS